MMALAFTIDHLLRKFEAGDKATAALLESRRLWFIPAVNPDGYMSNMAHAPHGGGDQRKNSAPGVCDSGGKGYQEAGVDLNRNYGLCWSGDCPTGHDVVPHADCGSSTTPCAEDYRGTSAFSEPESRAVRDFLGSHNFGAGVDTWEGVAPPTEAPRPRPAAAPKAKRKYDAYEREYDRGRVSKKEKKKAKAEAEAAGRPWDGRAWKQQSWK